MQPQNYDKIIQSTGGRWVPVYKRLFDSPFWREKPAFKHFIQMAETGVPVSYAGSPTPAAGEVLNTHVIPKMIQRVLVENYTAERPSRSATARSRRSTPDTPRAKAASPPPDPNARGEPRGD
jgi:multiple sugar transport system substrate-binding protein